MSTLGLEILFIFGLLLLNGLFAMSEIAMVSARKARLKNKAEEGDRNAQLALDLANSPGKFLSTVQVGITLIGVLSGAMGTLHLSDSLKHVLQMIPFIDRSAEYLAVFIVVSIITFLSVIIGELVPKRLALHNPERIAATMARPMNRLSKFASPVVNLLNHTSDFILSLLGAKKVEEPPVSEEEVRILIDEGLSAGVFRKAEQEWVNRVFELDEQTAEDLMTPRPQLVWLSLDDTNEENWLRVARSGHSHFPVYQKSHENVVGIVAVKSLWANISLTGHADLAALVTPPLYVPTTMHASKLIEEFRRTSKHLALVVDEFGGLQGLVTINDVMQAIVGTLPGLQQRYDPKAVQRPDGTWLVDALLEIDEMKKILGIDDDLPGEEEDHFSTLGGFLLTHIGHLPSEGECVVWENFKFEIIDMDNQRIDKVLITVTPKAVVTVEKSSDDQAHT